MLVLALILRVKPNEITLPISAWLLWCLIQFMYKQAFVGSDMDATISMQTFLKLAREKQFANHTNGMQIGINFKIELSIIF